MEPSELAEGVRVGSEHGTCAGTISRISRGETLFRHRPVIRAFWIRWDHDHGHEAAMLPGDTDYLHVLSEPAARLPGSGDLTVTGLMTPGGPLPFSEGPVILRAGETFTVTRRMPGTRP